MDATARIETRSSEGFAQEFQRFWNTLPDKAVFGVLLAGWILLFQFLGCTPTWLSPTGSLFKWMYVKWDDPSYDASHGKLIPWVVLALLWARRERLARSVAGVWWPGLLALAFALAVHIAGFVVQQPRLSMVALFFGVWVLVGLVWGRETLKASFFPFFVFAFCMPMGGTFAQGLTLPLRLFAAKVTAFISTQLLDISVIRNGTVLLDPSGRWHYEVAAKCSGIRSFLALLAITTIFSVLTMKRLWKRAILIALTLPLALVCNVMRLTTIILAANAFKSQAAGSFVDDWFGYVTYGVAMACVLLAGRWLGDKPPAVPP